MTGTRTARWPKPVLRLTPEEEQAKAQISLEFQQWGYTGLLGWVQAQGHAVAERLSRARADAPGPLRTVEIGCGSGFHFRYLPQGVHVGLDLDLAHLRRARTTYPDVPVIRADAYRLPFRSGSLDRVVSVYTFEHLSRLPECLAEVRRLLRPGGELLVGLPAEGGATYEVGRWLTSRWHFERRYGVDYLRLVRSEHCNTCREVLDELTSSFRVTDVVYLPLRVPTVHLNAVAVVRCEA